MELHFHPEDLSQIEIFFQSKSYGMASILNPHMNSVIGRNWDPHTRPLKQKLETNIEEPKIISTGQLFNDQSEEPS